MNKLFVHIYVIDTCMYTPLKNSKCCADHCAYRGGILNIYMYIYTYVYIYIIYIYAYVYV